MPMREIAVEALRHKEKLIKWPERLKWGHRFIAGGRSRDHLMLTGVKPASEFAI